jgi:hypothetical protein
MMTSAYATIVPNNTGCHIKNEIKIKIKILASECQTSGTYAKRAKQATTKRQLLVFSEHEYKIYYRGKLLKLFPWRKLSYNEI